MFCRLDILLFIKPKSLIHLVVLFFSLICSLMLAGSARAQLTFNPSAFDIATNVFDDSNSHNSSSQYGGIYYPFTYPWNGSSFTTSITDSTTSDQAVDTVTANLSGAAPIVTLTGVSLTQPSVNGGYAILNIGFRMQYTVGASGATITPKTLCPTFSVSGTVQNHTGSYASVQGGINFYDLPSGGGGSLLETDTYTYNNSTLGISFTSLPLAPSGTGGTYTLAAGDQLVVTGGLTLTVDPASIKLGTVNPTPIDLVGSQVGAGGNFQFQFSGASNVGYSVWASSDLKSWTVIGSGTFGITPATFTDTRTPGQSAQFYRVSTP